MTVPSEDDQEEITELYMGGAAVSDIAQTFSRSTTTIYQILERYQVPLRRGAKREREEADMHEVVRLYRDGGAPIIEIEIETGLNPNTIYTYLRRAGVPLRNTSRKQRVAILREARLRETVQSIAQSTGLEPGRVQKVVDHAGLTDYVKRDTDEA